MQSDAIMGNMAHKDSGWRCCSISEMCALAGGDTDYDLECIECAKCHKLIRPCKMLEDCTAETQERKLLEFLYDFDPAYWIGGLRFSRKVKDFAQSLRR